MKILRIIRSYIVPITIIILGVIISWYFITSKKVINKTPTASLPLIVHVSPAQYGNVSLLIDALGTVIPSQEVIIRSQVPGKILELGENMEPGGLISKNELLFRLDDVDYKNAVQRNENALAKAKADYDLEVGQQKVAKAEITQLKKTLPHNIKDIQKSTLALREPHLAQAKAALKTAQTNLNQALIDLERTIIKAPFNALVLERNVSTGSQASPSENLAKIVNTDIYWVEAFIPLDRFQILNFVHNREIPATITSSTGQIFQGKILRSIGNLNKSTLMGRVLIEILDPLGLKNTNSHLALLLGDHVQVNIIAGELDNAIAIPRSAIHDNTYVWILSNNTLDIRAIQIAWKDSDNVYITSGIEHGELVITSYIHTPIQGMPLQTTQNNNPIKH